MARGDVTVIMIAETIVMNLTVVSVSHSSVQRYNDVVERKTQIPNQQNLI